MIRPTIRTSVRPTLRGVPETSGAAAPGPVNTVAPVLTLTGTGEPGDTFSWTDGTWTTAGSLDPFTYSLRLDGVEVGTTEPHEIVEPEQGTYRLRVFATDEFGTRFKDSNSIVVQFTPVELTAAVIALDDEDPFLPYRVSPATADYAASSTLQWLRNGSPVGGQTSAAYTGDATGGDDFILQTTFINGAKNLVSDSNEVTYVEEEEPGLALVWEDGASNQWGDGSGNNWQSPS